MALPGVKIGPLDPDATSSFGQVSAHNSARQLIKKHAAAHPAVLTGALSRPLDPARTKGLDLEEVSAYVAGLRRDNGDPMLPEGATVVGAQVRGEADRPQILTFTFETASRRTAKWFAPYSAEALPESYAAGTELRKVKEMRDRGVVAFDDQAATTTVLTRENAGLRRQNEALRGQIQNAADSQNVGQLPDPVEGDTRPDDAVAADNEQLRRENAEMRERLAALENLVSERVAGQTVEGALAHASEADADDSDGDDDADDGPSDGTLTEDEPIEGYDELNAHQAAALLRGDDLNDEQREAVLAYERTHGNRKSVVAAGEQSVARG